MEVNEMKEDEDRPSVILPGDFGIPIPRELRFREMGLKPNAWSSRHFVGKRVVSETLATTADSTLTHKELDKMRFKLPPGARTTFHMAFSNDGKLVASCHGDHNVYVMEIKTGKVLQTLTGHPRTPWCVVFHPTQNDILASGCLAGHVRVWDLKSGSELLVTDSGTVIASIAFHPTVRLLAIGTFNEVIFWDWSRSVPLARCSTENTKEKVRLVRFDRLGRSLITGITNFPNAPATAATREANRMNARPTDDNLAGASRGGNLVFRPNILRNRHNTGAPAVPTRDSEADREDLLVNDEVMDLGDDPLVAAAAAAVADEDDQQVAVAEVLNDRQDRFQESYRQLVSHYEDLVEHYHTFLRTRIPPMLEISSAAEANSSGIGDPRLENPDRTAASAAVILEPESFPPLIAQLEDLQPESPVLTETVLPVLVDNPLIQDDEARPGPSRLMRVVGPPVQVDSVPSSTAINTTTIQDATINSSVATATERTPAAGAGLGSIEALAQNILEMQNLCSRARRNAPSLSIETQHIVELQHIRQHLEVLQDQTRRLQSSIRATLTSLASGSLAATLRSANFGSASSPRNPEASASESSPESPPASPAANTSEQSEESRSSSDSAHPPVIRRSISPSNSSNPNTFFRISIGQSDSGSSNLSRMRVPPMVTMRYDSAETSNSPGPSTRGLIQPQGPAPRRIIREFHVIPRQFGEEHSRNCPFSSNPSIRPPPRMRCLAETETPRLTMWPNFDDTGISVRDFTASGESAVVPRRNNMYNDASGSSNNNNNNNNQSTNATGSGGGSNVGFGYQPFNIQDAPQVGSNLNNNNVPTPQSFSQVLSNSGPVSNDVGVRVFLTVRQNREGHNGPTEESWQRVFPSGLALVPPAVREGRRTSQPFQRRRRAQWVCQLGTTSSANRLCHNNPTASTSSQQQQPQSSRASEASQLSASVSTNQPPHRLGSLTRSFFIRTQDELIPVYSVTSNESPQVEVVRDGLQSNVFQYPIGLFLEGPFDTQNIGIYWPPSTAREEDEGSSNRSSESLIPTYASPGTNRIRILYLRSSMEIHLPQGVLTFIQPGLPILDAVTDYGSLQRPRAAEGTVWIDNVGSFFEALERLFYGARNGRRPFSSRVPVGVTRVSQQILNLSSRGNSRSNGGSNGGYAHGTVGERRPAQMAPRIDNPRRIITFAQDANEPGLSIWSDHHSLSRSSRLSRDYFHGPPSSSQASEEASNRTVLSLAVDTAASELLRNPSGFMQQSTSESSRLLPVESRIERVLNERGNRGAQSASSMGEESNRSRLEDIQRRISMLSHWSRGHGHRLSSSSSAGTQTSQSFLEPASQRRRVYPSPNPNANEEAGPPSRMARFSEMERSNNQSNQEFGYTGPFGDHWVIRRQRRLSSPRPRLLTSAAASSSVPPADGTSARTRASAQLLQLQSQQQNNELPETSNNRPRSSVTLHFPPPPIAHQFQGSNEDPPDPAGARFYPGYIPEILITPRARPPTYYTMDAATTAFLSSRIQKWDFSEFFIPDITKRDDCIVVRECSLHSDACLDISSDSEFLAVLQPSDSGAYSALGVYSLRDECLGDMMYIFHFDQNTVSVSISPSCDYIVVGYAGRGPLYRFVQPSKNIGQILSLTRDEGDRDSNNKMRLVPVRELYTDSQSPLMAINCISYLPVPGMGIIYGTNTGDLVLLS